MTQTTYTKEQISEIKTIKELLVLKDNCDKNSLNLIFDRISVLDTEKDSKITASITKKTYKKQLSAMKDDKFIENFVLRFKEFQDVIKSFYSDYIIEENHKYVNKKEEEKNCILVKHELSDVLIKDLIQAITEKKSNV